MEDEFTDEIQSLNIGEAIGQQLSASIKNMDIMSLIQKMVAETPEDEESDEIRQKLQGVVQQYEAMSDGEKEEFVTQMKNLLAVKLGSKLKEMPLDMSGLEDAIKEAILPKLYLFLAVAIVIFILIVFFGYKLYKSIRDKEKKKEEKRKLKEMKKKK